MWQRFTETSRRAIVGAEQEAIYSDSAQVETEHLLLALLDDKESLGARILVQSGVTLKKVGSLLKPETEMGTIQHTWSKTEIEKLGEEFQVDPALVRRIESRLLLKLREERPLPELKLSASLKRVLELASDEARQIQEAIGQPCNIGTEHLLLGLLRDKEGRAADILNTLGLNLEETRTSVIEFLRAQGEEPMEA